MIRFHTKSAQYFNLLLTFVVSDTFAFVLHFFNNTVDHYKSTEK